MNKLQRFLIDTAYGYMLAIIIFDSLVVGSILLWVMGEILLSVIVGSCFVFLLYKTFFSFSGIIKFFINIKRRIWNKYILCWWYNYTDIPEDEFDNTLNLDVNAMLVMNKKEREKYHKDIARRRQIAHERDLERWV